MNKNEDIWYAYEYQESSGNFHYNKNGTAHKQNTAGYRTICFTTESEWEPFYKSLKKRYDFEKRAENVPPSFETIKQEWQMYIELRQDIGNSLKENAIK